VPYHTYLILFHTTASRRRWCCWVTASLHGAAQRTSLSLPDACHTTLPLHALPVTPPPLCCLAPTPATPAHPSVPAVTSDHLPLFSRIGWMTAPVLNAADASGGCWHACHHRTCRTHRCTARTTHVTLLLHALHRHCHRCAVAPTLHLAHAHRCIFSRTPRALDAWYPLPPPLGVVQDGDELPLASTERHGARMALTVGARRAGFIRGAGADRAAAGGRRRAGSDSPGRRGVRLHPARQNKLPTALPHTSTRRPRASAPWWRWLSFVTSATIFLKHCYFIYTPLFVRTSSVCAVDRSGTAGAVLWTPGWTVCTGSGGVYLLLEAAIRTVLY